MQTHIRYLGCMGPCGKGYYCNRWVDFHEVFFANSCVVQSAPRESIHMSIGPRSKRQSAHLNKILVSDHWNFIFRGGKNWQLDTSMQFGTGRLVEHHSFESSDGYYRPLHMSEGNSSALSVVTCMSNCQFLQPIKIWRPNRPWTKSLHRIIKVGSKHFIFMLTVEKVQHNKVYTITGWYFYKNTKRNQKWSKQGGLLKLIPNEKHSREGE